MEGSNPFALWEENPENIFGRKEEGRLFKVFVNATISKQPGVINITGIPGYGKSSLLRYFKHLAEKGGLHAPLVKAEKGENFETLVDKLYHEIIVLENVPLGQRTPINFKELVDVGLDKQHFGIIFLIDDIDNMKKAEEVIVELVDVAKILWKKKSISFVITSTKEFQIKSEVVSNIILKPFSEHDAKEYVEKTLKDKELKIGEECLRSIMADTGGNQKLFKNVCRFIYDRLRDNEKIMTKGHYLAYLPYIMSMLSRESFGRMYQEVPAAERDILRVLAKDEIHISDVAKELKKPLGPITALTKRLLERGQIIKVERGRYKIFSKLYARYVIQRSQ